MLGAWQTSTKAWAEQFRLVCCCPTHNAVNKHGSVTAATIFASMVPKMLARLKYVYGETNSDFYRPLHVGSYTNRLESQSLMSRKQT